MQLCHLLPSTNSFPEEKLCALPQLKQHPCQHRVNACVVPEIRKHQSCRLYRPEPPLPFHDPTSPAFLASCLNFHTCVGKRPLLIGGENLHLFPVVSELRTTVETHHVRSRMRGSLTAALSWFAGLGKADPLVPASEQSVKDIHNLLPAAWLSSLKYLGRPNCLYSWPEMVVTVNSASYADFVSLDFHIQMTQIVSGFAF